MQKIQLYIDGQRAEMFKDESVSITQTIQNVRDIGSIFTDFSKTFNLPASKTNNMLFKHYYNYDITENTSLNANNTIPAVIELNYQKFRKGFIGLNGVQLKNNKPYSYNITFFGETIDLKNKLKEKKLSDVFQGVNTYDHAYSAANVKTGLETSIASGNIKYPLISHSDRFFYDSGSHTAGDRNLHYDEGGGGGGSHNHGVRYTDLKPAIKLSKVIEEIEDYADIEFTKTDTDDFFNTSSNPMWNNLYLWLSRVKGPLGLNLEGTSEINMPITSIDFQNANPAEWLPNLQGTSSTSSPYSRVQNGIWTCRPVSSFYGSTGHAYGAEFSVVTSQNVTITIEETTFGTVLGSASGTGSLTTGMVSITSSSIFGFLYSIRFRVTSTDPSVSFTPTITFKYTSFGGYPPTATTYLSTVTGTDIQPNGAVNNIVISDQVPDIKIIDFLTGIFKMFNLTAYVKNDGKIKVTTLDNFYASGVVRDISEYVKTDESSLNYPIPYQEIAFRFQKPNTFLAINFSEINNKIFANLENTTVDSADVQTTNRGNKYIVEVPFGKMVYERLTDLDTGSNSPAQYGYCTDKDQNPVNIQPLVLFIENESLSTGNRLSFYQGTSANQAAPLNTYNRPSNTYGTSQSINFGEEVDEYTATAEDDSLFENYYKTYIVDTFNSRRRLFKVKAFLPLKILLNFTLADRFDINGRRFKINSIETNLATGESSLELLNEV